MMKKFKKTVKKAKGIEEKIRRIEFYDRLKNPPEPDPQGMPDTQEIIDRIKKYRDLASFNSPYNAGTNGIMKRLRKFAGLK